VVEGLVLGRTDLFGDRLPPFLRVGEDRVDVEDHAAEREDAVAHDLADCVLGVAGLHGFAHGGFDMDAGLGLAKLPRQSP
jgi:hypothetical protein